MQSRKLSNKKIRLFSHSHATSKYQSQGLNPNNLAPESSLTTTIHDFYEKITFNLCFGKLCSLGTFCTPLWFQVGRRSYRERTRRGPVCLEPREWQGREYKTRGEAGGKQVVQSLMNCLRNGNILLIEFSQCWSSAPQSRRPSQEPSTPVIW